MRNLKNYKNKILNLDVLKPNQIDIEIDLIILN